MKSSRSAHWKTTRPFTRSSITISPSSGVRKRSAQALRPGGGPSRARHVRAYPGPRAPPDARAGRALRRPPAGRERGLPARLELLGRTPAAIDGATLDERVGARTIERRPFALEEWTFVPSEIEPAERLDDRAGGLGGRALAVRVLDAQDEPATVPARVQEAEERRPRAAEMQRAGGARCESSPDRHRAELIGRSRASQRRRFETRRGRPHTGGGSEVASWR